MKNYKKIYWDVKKYCIGTNEFSYLPSDKLFFYPIDLEFTLEDEEFYYAPKDNTGIPCKMYASVGLQYNPTRVAAYGLANFNLFLNTGDEDLKVKFLKCADWFLSVKSARYEYHFDWGDLKVPWISCMAQGEAASVLIRAYQVTDNIIYLKHAKKSLDPFFYKVLSGGVQSELLDGSVFLEEYPSQKPSHALNGFLYALIGLGEFCNISKKEKHKSLFLALVTSLEKQINLWSTGSWSLYEVVETSKIKNYCTPSYHNLQISQLKWLYAQHPSSSIQKTIFHWEKGRNTLFIRLKAMGGKILFRLIYQAQR